MRTNVNNDVSKDSPIGQARVLCYKYYHSMYFCLPFHWLRGHHVTCKQLPTNKCFAANILVMRNWNYKLVWKWRISSPSWQSDLTYLVDQKNGDRMIKNNYWTQLSQNIVSCQCLADRLFVSADLLPTDKSRYFAQPRSTMVNYLLVPRRPTFATHLTYSTPLQIL